MRDPEGIVLMKRTFDSVLSGYNKSLATLIMSITLVDAEEFNWRDCKLLTSFWAGKGQRRAITDFLSSDHVIRLDSGQTHVVWGTFKRSKRGGRIQIDLRVGMERFN